MSCKLVCYVSTIAAKASASFVGVVICSLSNFGTFLSMCFVQVTLSACDPFGIDVPTDVESELSHLQRPVRIC